MRTRAIALLGVVLVALMAAPQFTAAPGGIGSAGDQGCSCHGGASADTSVFVVGLPYTYNASETYTLTVTVVNDVMEIYDDGGDEWIILGARLEQFKRLVKGFAVLQPRAEIDDGELKALHRVRALERFATLGQNLAQRTHA